MSLETNKLKFTNLEISNSGSDLFFDGTESLRLQSSISIGLPAQTLTMNGNEIYNTSGVSSPNNVDLELEAKGTGDVVFKSPSTQTPPNIRVGDDGIVYFSSIPTTSITTQSVNSIINTSNLITLTNFSPTLTGASGGAPTYTGQQGSYYRVGNLVWFRSVITISSLNTLTGTDTMRFSIPIAIDYNTLNMPQALTITYYDGISPTATDFTMVVGGTGNASPGASINYGVMYYRSNNNSAGLTDVKFNQITLPFTLRYSGCYYDF